MFSAGGCCGAVERAPKSASKSTAAGRVVIGGERGEGKLIGWTVDAVGRLWDGTSECVYAGRCTDWVWFGADTGDVAGWNIHTTIN